MNNLNFETISSEEKIFIVANRIKKIESHKKKLLNEIIDCDKTIESLNSILEESKDINSDIDIERILRKNKLKQVNESKKYTYVTVRLFETIKEHLVNNKPENVTLTSFLRAEVKRYLENNTESLLVNHVAEYEEFYEAWRNEYPLKYIQLGIFKDTHNELEKIAASLNVTVNHLLQSIIYNLYQNM